MPREPRVDWVELSAAFAARDFRFSPVHIDNVLSYGQLQFIPLPLRSLSLVPLLHPAHHLFNLPLMSCSYEVWLCADVQDSVRVPMVSTSRYQHLMLAIPGASIMPMITDITPDIAAAIYQG